MASGWHSVRKASRTEPTCSKIRPTTSMTHSANDAIRSDSAIVVPTTPMVAIPWDQNQMPAPTKPTIISPSNQIVVVRKPTLIWRASNRRWRVVSKAAVWFASICARLANRLSVSKLENTSTTLPSKVDLAAMNTSIAFTARGTIQTISPA